MVTHLATAYPLFPSLLPVKHWSKILSMSPRDTTPIAPLLGEDENSIIPVKIGVRLRSKPGAIS
jgi:hypothetical protein